MLQTIQEAIVVSMGGTIKKPKKKKKSTAKTPEQKAAKERAKLQALASMGFSVGPQS